LRFADAGAEDREQVTEAIQLRAPARKEACERGELACLLEPTVYAEPGGVLRDPALEASTFGIERQRVRVPIGERGFEACAVGTVTPLEPREHGVDVIGNGSELLAHVCLPGKLDYLRSGARLL
jgi:hypothetical protein